MSTLLALAMTLLAQAKENPVYTYWKDCRPGSWVTLTGESTAGAATQKLETTQTLLSLTPDTAVVEESQKPEGGKAVTAKREIKAADEKPDTIESEGDETITVGRQKLACHWIVLLPKGRSDGVKARLWLTREIPGGIARLEMLKAGQDAPSLTMVAVDWLKR